MTQTPTILHGSVFSHGGAGCLLLGKSGTGKSRLVADIVMLGGKLVADDQVQLSLMSGMLTASAAPGLGGVLELRGYGLLKMHDYHQKHVLHLVVELAEGEHERLPRPAIYEALGQKLPLLRLPPVPGTTAAILLLYLKAMQEGRILPPDWKP